MANTRMPRLLDLLGLVTLGFFLGLVCDNLIPGSTARDSHIRLSETRLEAGGPDVPIHTSRSSLNLPMGKIKRQKIQN